jgi:hypothetical protein
MKDEGENTMLCPLCGRFKLVFQGSEGTFAVAGNGRLLDRNHQYIRDYVHDGRLCCSRCGELAYNDRVFEKELRIELK